LTIPAGAEFERDRHIHCSDYGFENGGNELLILQQRRATPVVADFFNGTTHVDVNNLRAALDIKFGGFSQQTRIGTGDLYGLGFHLAFVVNSTRTFFAGPDARIGSGHFRDRITGAQLFAQLPVRPVRYASHGRNKDVIAELIGTELHAEENYRRKGRYFSRNDFPMAVCTAGSDLVERSRIKVRNIGPLQHRHLRAVPMQAIDGGVFHIELSLNQ